MFKTIVAWFSGLAMSTSPVVEKVDTVSENLSIPISKKSVDLIIKYEVSSREYYDKYLARPTVPAWQTTQSGPTLGWGIDIGHMSKAEVKSAFNGILKPKDIEVLQSLAGMKGKNAYYNALPKIKNTIRVDWNQAEKIFYNYTLPKFSKQTSNAFGLTPTRLHPHSNGALTSLVYNRGPSLANTDSRKEMRWIKANIAAKQESKVPNDIRSMKRLWASKNLKGLLLRRDDEAKLFQEGLDARK